jgi:hypothetical protein
VRRVLGRGIADAWAHLRDRGIIEGFIAAVLTAIVGAAVFRLALGEVLASAVGGVLLYGAGALIFYSIQAPVRLRLDDALSAPAEQGPTEPEVAITAWWRGAVWFQIENEGPTDTFSATHEATGDPDSRVYLNWGPQQILLEPGEENKFRRDETLATGAHGICHGYLHDARALTLRVFTHNHGRLQRDFVVRQSRLLLSQIKEAAEPWPDEVDSGAWVEKVEALITEVDQYAMRFDQLEVGDLDSAHAVWKSLERTFGESGIVGPLLSQRQHESFRTVRDSFPNEWQIGRGGRIAGLRDALIAVRRDLDAARAAGNDAPE